MRCGFTRTYTEFGPKGGIKLFRRWRCSRQAKHDVQDTDRLMRPVGIAHVCTQHRQVMERSAAKTKAKLAEHHRIMGTARRNAHISECR